MTERDLLRDPIWRAEELGSPIPPTSHAVSVALPLWEHVVGYEEKAEAVMSRLSTGYPRFVIHPLVAKLGVQLSGDRPCLPFPSRRAAEKAAAFMRANSPETRNGYLVAKTVSKDGAHGVITNEEGYLLLKSFWQHTGLIVSTRQAEGLLQKRSQPQNDPRPRLRRQLATFYHCADGDIFLAPTGMAAQFAALELLNKRSPGRPTVQLGFPYVDTLKLQQKLGHGGILLHDLEHIEHELSALLKTQPVAGCFCEIPGNPMLGSPDMRKISPILRRHEIPLVADDVVATPVNVDLSACADLIATSLTKFVVGTGQAMGGALICNPESPFYSELKQLAAAAHEELLWPEDAEVCAAGAENFPQRMERHNANGLFIAERLRSHPVVERVYYPKWEFAEAYEAVRKPQGGYGALITFLPRRAEQTAPRIYDRLQVCKGPSLGTVFTLACPFTLLAHYTELEWAEACGVSRHLIRVSVGLEDPEELWARIDQALGG